jgi:predicted DNA-binding transcriptional regulator YafY
MADTAARLLKLLGLLQRRSAWSGQELADALDVDGRTVRRDIERLRSLGYQVEANPGTGGGYRLGVGAQMPPLLLDEQEATAMAVVLGVMASVAVPGVEQGALAALTKLDRLLPPHLRGQLVSLRASTIALLPHMDAVPAEQLIALARACDGHERVSFRYRSYNGAETERRVEPHRLVATDRRWYMVGFDLDRDDWRTFRVDRATLVRLTGHTFEPRHLEDPGGMVARGIASAQYDVMARVRIAAPLDAVSKRLGRTAGALHAAGTDTIAEIGADGFEWLAGYLIDTRWDFEILDHGPHEVSLPLRAQAGRSERPPGCCGPTPTKGYGRRGGWV